MKCPICHGKGLVSNEWFIKERGIPCMRCDGRGDVEPTHQEFIQNCNTEELAEFLVEIVCGEELKNHIKEMGYINMHSYQTEMREWLKEKHGDGKS